MLLPGLPLSVYLSILQHGPRVDLGCHDQGSPQACFLCPCVAAPIFIFIFSFDLMVQHFSLLRFAVLSTHLSLQGILNASHGCTPAVLFLPMILDFVMRFSP